MASATDEQRDRWLPGIASGETILAIAMTEPGTGSDLASIATRAKRDGDGWVMNGQKTFITNDETADMVVVAARTSDDRHGGLSLVVVEREMPGFERGNQIDSLASTRPTPRSSSSTTCTCRRRTCWAMRERGSSSSSPGSSRSASCSRSARWPGARRPSTGRSPTSRSARRSVGRSACFRTRGSRSRSCAPRSRSGAASSTGASSATWPAPARSRRRRWRSGGRPTCSARSPTPACSSTAATAIRTEYPIAKAYVDARVSRIYAGRDERTKELIGKTMGL